MAAFAVISYGILELFQRGNLWSPKIYDDPDFFEKWGWTKGKIFVPLGKNSFILNRPHKVVQLYSFIIRSTCYL